LTFAHLKSPCTCFFGYSEQPTTNRAFASKRRERAKCSQEDFLRGFIGFGLRSEKRKAKPTDFKSVGVHTKFDRATVISICKRAFDLGIRRWHLWEWTSKPGR
jgi:hypothetical protein